jgi:hypothetical protein
MTEQRTTWETVVIRDRHYTVFFHDGECDSIQVNFKSCSHRGEDFNGYRTLWCAGVDQLGRQREMKGTALRAFKLTRKYLAKGASARGMEP